MNDKKPSQASVLLGIIRERYRPFMGQDGNPYAVLIDGPNIALPLNGGGGLRSQLARIYADITADQVPGGSALTDAITVFTGLAHRCDPEPVHLRVAPHGDGVVLDLGTADGRCVVVSGGSWSIEAESPVLFRRTKLIAPLPDPDPNGSLSGLRSLINVSDQDWPLVVGWMIGALMPDLPYPILGLFGLRGTAKSNTTRMVIGTISPSPAPTRSTPKDVKSWIIGAYAGWITGIDNISLVSDEFSDWLCRASTGEGMVDRALYTDADVSVIQFRRPIILNGIALVGGQGDLANRLMPIELLPITRYRDEHDLWTEYAHAQPHALGALLDILAAVLTIRHEVNPPGRVRMADFARVLAATDRVTGWDSLARYTELATLTEADSLSPFGEALRDFVQAATDGTWTGTPAHLWELLTPTDRDGNARPPKPWPVLRRMREQIKRDLPALRSYGIEVDLDQRATDRNRTRLVVLTDTSVATSSDNTRIPSSASSASATQHADLRRRSDEDLGSPVRTPSASSAYSGHADDADDATDDAGTRVVHHDTRPDQHFLPAPDDADDADDEIRGLSDADPLGAPSAVATRLRQTKSTPLNRPRKDRP